MFDEFKEMTEKFYNKEVTVGEYKGFSGNYGSYAQRGAAASMLRLRMSAGVVTPQKLCFIADTVTRYGVDRIHNTTCQTIQLHNLAGSIVGDIMEGAAKVGIFTIGGGGDNPRNVMASPLSGVDPEEYFDVIPYAEKAAEYLLSLIGKIKMPRKLKVGFSSSPKNECHVTFRDLGFMARPDGKFDVYSAGGLGNNPKLGVLVDTAVEPAKILYYIKAMVDVFIANGNYTNRAKARTRYMQDTLGRDGYVAAYKQCLANALETESLDISIDPPTAAKSGAPYTPANARIHAQKQENLFYVSYHPLGGNIAPETIVKLADAIDGMSGVQMRLSPDESIYFVNCTGEEAEKIAAITADGANTVFETSTSCIGATICQIGLRDSQGLLSAMLDAVRAADLPDGALPQVHVSGCPSSCGAHQSAEIGFVGNTKRVDGKPVPGFMLFLNGSAAAGTEKFGEQIGVIAAEDIPAFMVELGKMCAGAGLSYTEWIKDHRADLDALAAKYI